MTVATDHLSQVCKPVSADRYCQHYAIAQLLPASARRFQHIKHNGIIAKCLDALGAIPAIVFHQAG